MTSTREISSANTHMNMNLQGAILPLSSAAMALPPLSIRGDLGVLSTAAARYITISCCVGLEITCGHLLR